MSFSSQSSSSTSEPTVTETPENALLDQLSQYASGLAQQMDAWASQEFAKTSAVTDQTVGNFFNVANKMVGMSNTLTDQYNNITAKDYQQLHDEANNYASPAHMAVDMGQAGATQAQAGDAAIHNSEEALKSYGINPSDGRYAGLDKAAAVQNAANIAGAQNMQRNADIATGQRLRSESLQFGAQLPSAIANINNTAIQANAGASNASLANANTGANLKSLADKYLQTAMGIKLPLSGQKSQSQSNGFSTNPGQQGGNHGGGSGGGNGGGGNGGFGGGNGGPAWMPQHGGPNSEATGVPPGNLGPKFSPNPGPKSSSLPPNWDEQGDLISQIYKGLPTTETMPPEWRPQDTGEMTISQTGNDNPWDGGGGFDYGQQNPFSSQDFGQTLPQDQFGGADQTYGGLNQYGNDLGNLTYDSRANNSDPGWGQTYDQPAPYTDWGNGADAFTGGQYGNSDTSYAGGDTYAGDYSAPSDDYDMGGAYAGGGAIPDNGILQAKIAPRAMPPKPGMGPTTGGMVPRQASPSMGRQTDDVPANLNAGEFVIPRDVAMWKGQEFFQNLIAQSRKKRVTAPAHGKPPQPGNNPAMQRPPTFTSKPMR